MKLLYIHQHEGFWFSKNGHKAYLRGERPGFMFEPGDRLEPTINHHIARLRGGSDYTRELVMFYRRIK